jgi:hypothetical protein
MGLGTRISLALIAVLLLRVNVYGLFQNFSFDRSRNPASAIRAVDNLLNDTAISDDAFVGKINALVHENIAHYWPSDPAESLRVPFTQNYLLYLASYVKPSIYRNYEYCSYTRALQRGVGLCSEAAIVVTDILGRKGIEAHMVYFNGHVVTIAKLPDSNGGHWLYLDPYYNVIIPTDFDSLNRNPDLVRPYYEASGLDQGDIDALVGFMKNTPNRLFTAGVTGYTDCNWKKITVRKTAEVAKWILPILLLMPAALAVLRKVKKA